MITIKTGTLKNGLIKCDHIAIRIRCNHVFKKTYWFIAEKSKYDDIKCDRSLKSYWFVAGKCEYEALAMF